MLFFVGLIIAIIRLMQDDAPPGLWGVTSISVVRISAADWTVGLFQGAIPQVPTTLLNSCIAVCKLADDLYPHRKTGVNVRSVSVSVGLLNVVLCWFGKCQKRPNKCQKRPTSVSVSRIMYYYYYYYYYIIYICVCVYMNIYIHIYII